MAGILTFFRRNEKKIEFSEGLLQTLCYETDVGPIPREIDLDVSMNKPKHMYSTNWNFSIQGCYWCSDDIQKEWFGICCSKECLFYFHDWCIERVKVLTQRKFCRFPGCGKVSTNNYYCDTSHKDEFGKAFPKWVDQESLYKKVLRNGPSWYNSKIDQPTTNYYEDESHLNKQQSSNKPLLTQTLNPTREPTDTEYTSDQSKRFYASYQVSNIITPMKTSYIPESSRIPDTVTHSPNTEFNSEYRQYDSYAVSSTVAPERESNRNSIQTTGYNPIQGTCTLSTVRGEAKHELPNGYVSPFNITSSPTSENQPMEFGYNKSSTNLDGKRSFSLAQTKAEQQNISSKSWEVENSINSQKGELVFCEILTRFLYEKCDVGPIPRKLFETLPDSCIKTTPGNSNAIIPGCYWCCENNQSIHGVACSDKCFFLLNEWCHRKYEKSVSNTNKRLCKFPLCDSSATSERDCCKREHFDRYQNRFTSKFGGELKSTNFALGPKWYRPNDDHIDFYQKDEPFYEFTNFFQCTHLYIDNVSWPTTEHYFQSQKFAGTPHVETVRRKHTPNDVLNYARTPNVRKWVRNDWEKVQVSVMLKALREKFSQNPDLGDLLIRTGDRKLFEHTHSDKFWGDGGDGRGQNMLGQLLVQVRLGLQRRIPYLPTKLEHFTHGISFK